MKFKYYFDFDKLALTLQHSRSEELCPILIESIAYFSFFDVRNLKDVEGLFMFFPTKI